MTQTRLVEVRQNVLKHNDVLARELRTRFEQAGVFVASFVSSPGSGKTAFLEKTLTLLKEKYRVAALVGDLATENDAARLARAEVPVKQIVTGTICHLEAQMVSDSLQDWDLNELDCLFIENVGNLVCPSSYDLGEALRVVLMSTTEGEDKPRKYPTIFNTADVAVITKMDLAEACEFDLEAAHASIQAVRPGMKIFEVSSKTGAGMDEWLEFLQSHFVKGFTGFAFSILIFVVSMCVQTNGQTHEKPKANRNVSQPAAVKGRFTSGDSAQIPIELDGDIIFLKVKVNNSPPLKFLFDTGASASAVSVRQAEKLKLKKGARVKGKGTGGNIQASLIEGVSLSVAGASVTNQTVAAASFGGDNGPDFEGVIGYDFISQFVVEIDFLKKVMTLYNPQTYKYNGKGETIPLLLEGRRTPLVKTKVSFNDGTSVESKLELDTGADGAITFNTPFVDKNKLLATLSKTIVSAANGAGGESETVSGRAKSIQLGNFVFNNPIISLARDKEGSMAETATDGILGNEILRRFKVVIDYSRRRLILEPNAQIDEPFEVDSERD